MWSYYGLLRRSVSYSASGKSVRRPGKLARCVPSTSSLQQRSLTTDDKDSNKNKTSEKRNFNRDTLQSAARGELKQKHASGIPKLAGRHKARLAPPPKRSGGRFTKIPKSDADMMDDDLDWISDSASGAAIGTKGSATETFYFDPRSAKLSDAFTDFDEYYATELLNSDRYYWNEEDFEVLGGADLDDAELLDDEAFEIELDDSDASDNQIMIDPKAKKALGLGKHNDDDTDGEDDDNDGDEEDAPFDRRGRQSSSDEMRSEPTNLEEQFFFGQNDVFEIAALDEKLFGEKEEGISDIALPLRPHGQNLDDFLEAMIEHPTKYAQLMSEQLHPDSKREPKPFIPKSRLNPPLSFVESHARFLFVSGLPPLAVNGEKGDVNNPVHRDTIQKTIARLFNVDSDRVFPSSTSSGFVGFASPRELVEALKKRTSEPNLYAPASISVYHADDGDKQSDFAMVSPRTTVEVNGIPPGNTTTTLLEKLFPDGSEVGSVYRVTPDKVRFLSPDRALIRFDSEEQAESAVVSQAIGQQLKMLGEYPVRIFRARRELVHAGFDGPFKINEKRKMGPRLIVDGDMPTKAFYLSHARVALVRNLDPNASKEEIASVFQPYCARPRDIDGSVEFVTCERGLPTGRAYVGFDIPWEAEKAIKAMNGLAQMGGTVANLRLVKDRRIPGISYNAPEKRPDRDADELLDELNNWEKYVDSEDLNILGDAGISKVALDEALRGIRYNNASFGVFDASIRAESLQPEKMTGELYKELVQMYISTLKECLATPENVGELYEAVHFPGEQFDLSVFEREKQRQESLQERRS